MKVHKHNCALRTLNILWGVGLLSALLPCLVLAESAAMTVNKVALPQAQLDLLVGQFTSQGQEDNAELRERLAEELATRESVAQEAARLDLDRLPDVQAALASARRDVLVKAYIADYAARHPVPEEEVRLAYEQQKTATGTIEYRVRHILVKTAEEANEIYAVLKNGGGMETLARAKSLDSSSRAIGGDIGWQIPTALLPETRSAITNLNKGQFSEPVGSNLGWHILKVDDMRPYEFPAYDKLAPALRQQLQTKSNLNAIARIRERVQVKFR